MATKLIKDSFYLSKIREILGNNDDAYKQVFEINQIIKRWESG